MKIANLFRVYCLAGILTLGCQTSQAKENDGIFIFGQYGVNAQVSNCNGNCSVDSNGTAGAGITFNPPVFATSFCDRETFSLEYSRYQFTVNGNPLNVRKQSVNWYLEWNLGQSSGFTLAASPIGLAWQTSEGTISSSRTNFYPELKFNLLYQISQSLDLSFTYSGDDIYSNAYPDFTATKMDFGFRWYL